MEIFKFFKGMLPYFSRSQIQRDLTAAHTEYSTMVMPSLDLGVKEFKGNFKSIEAKELAKLYASLMGTGSGNIFADLQKHFKTLSTFYPAVDAEIASELSERVVPAALSARTANALRLVSVLGFLNRYVMGLINTVMHFECMASGSGMSFVSDVTPGELDRIKARMIDFAQLLKAVTGVKDAAAAFAEIPEVVIENKDVTEAFGAGAVDPFGVFRNGLQFNGSPIYWISMQIAEYQNNNYRKMEAQKRAFEKRMLAYKRASAGNPSAGAESELEVITSQIAALDEKLRTYERGLA